MKWFCTLPLVSLLAASCAVAQSTVLHAGAGATSSSWMHYPDSFNPAQCPAALRAQHGGALPASKAINDLGVTPSEPGTDRSALPAAIQQRLHLTLKNLSAQDIVSAQVTVHGLNDKSRVIPLAATPQGENFARKLRVDLLVKANDQGSNDVALRQFTAVTSIDLDSLTYADGSHWQAASPGACRVAVDPFMLVEASR